MEAKIKKWELILEQDLGKDITYGRKVLMEMLNDFKQALTQPNNTGDREYSNCCGALIDTDEQSEDICTNCGDRI